MIEELENKDYIRIAYCNNCQTYNFNFHGTMNFCTECGERLVQRTYKEVKNLHTLKDKDPEADNNALSKEDKEKADNYVKQTCSEIIKDALDKDYSQKGRSMS